jgi:hypothetical protein
MALLTSFLAAMVFSNAQAGLVPTLTILDVSASSKADGRTCEVTLLNTHSRPAVAWVLTQLPERRSGHTSDVSASPELAVAPGKTRLTKVACREGEPLPSLEVIGVAYDDGSVFGDQATLEQLLFTSQRKRATAMRELAALLKAAQVSPRSDLSAVSVFSEFIDQATGPEIDAGARLFAKSAVQRATATGNQQAASREQIDAIQRTLVMELTTAATRLDRASKPQR